MKKLVFNPKKMAFEPVKVKELTIEQKSINLKKLFNLDADFIEKQRMKKAWFTLTQEQKMGLCCNAFKKIRPMNCDFLFKDEEQWSDKDKSIYQMELTAQALQDHPEEHHTKQLWEKRHKYDRNLGISKYKWECR